MGRIAAMKQRSNAAEVRVAELARSELRVADSEEGVFEGYAATWDTVDSYNSMFQRGAFAKTIQERGDKIKLLWDHKELIGKILEVREDDHGLHVRGKLTLDVARAKETRALMLDGSVDTLSFMFVPVKQHRDKDSGVRVITEVKLLEVSPVVFAANEATSITAVRSEDFSATLEEIKIYELKYQLMHALSRTLDDIWYDQGGDLALLDEALAQFHAMYLSWAKNLQAMNAAERSAKLFDNELQRAFYEFLEGRNTHDVAAESSFSVAELELLQRGECLPQSARGKLAELPQEVRDAHSKIRLAKLESCLSEIRAGLTHAEATRISALLSRDEPTKPADETRSVHGAGLAELLGNVQRFINAQSKEG